LGLRPNQGGGLEARKNGDQEFRCLSACARLVIPPILSTAKLTPKRAADRGATSGPAPRNRAVDGKRIFKTPQPSTQSQ
jgi:hypothetical protein